jgi:nucleoside-diphosphate-sugar epimerase
MQTRRVQFVVAGTGYAGRRVLLALPADRSSGLSRSAEEIGDISVQPLDLDQPGAQAIVVPESSVLLYSIPPGGSSESDDRLAAFLRRIAPFPERIVYLSTSGVYGNRNGKQTTENDTANPSTTRARRRWAAEQMLEARCDKEGSELYVLRVPAIYGPDRLGLERLRDGADILREADSGPGNRIHVDDLVTCCVAAMTGNAPPGIYNIADGDLRSSNWFACTVANLAGLAAPTKISYEEAERSWSEQRLSFIRESRRLDSQKMRTILKVKPRYADAETGILASLATETD